jgi:hypothetical protein
VYAVYQARKPYAAQRDLILVDQRGIADNPNRPLGKGPFRTQGAHLVFHADDPARAEGRNEVQSAERPTVIRIDCGHTGVKWRRHAPFQL